MARETLPSNRPSILQQMREAVDRLRAARARLGRVAPGSSALVRGGRVEIVSARRAAAVRSRPPSARPTLVADLGRRREPTRLTFLIRP